MALRNSSKYLEKFLVNILCLFTSTVLYYLRDGYGFIYKRKICTFYKSGESEILISPLNVVLLKMLNEMQTEKLVLFMQINK